MAAEALTEKGRNTESATKWDTNKERKAGGTNEPNAGGGALSQIHMNMKGEGGGRVGWSIVSDAGMHYKGTGEKRRAGPNIYSECRNMGDRQRVKLKRTEIKYFS